MIWEGQKFSTSSLFLPHSIFSVMVKLQLTRLNIDDARKFTTIFQLWLYWMAVNYVFSYFPWYLMQAVTW